MFYLIDNYTSEVLDESDDRAEMEQALSELQAETGLFIYSIVEAPSKEALMELEKLARETVAQTEQSLSPQNQEFMQAMQRLLTALAQLDNPEYALELLDMVLAANPTISDRYISGIQSTCKNCGYVEMIEVPEQVGPIDIAQAMQSVLVACPECQERARQLQAKQELAVEKIDLSDWNQTFYDEDVF